MTFRRSATRGWSTSTRRRLSLVSAGPSSSALTSLSSGRTGLSAVYCSQWYTVERGMLFKIMPYLFNKKIGIPFNEKKETRKLVYREKIFRPVLPVKIFSHRWKSQFPQNLLRQYYIFFFILVFSRNKIFFVKFVRDGVKQLNLRGGEKNK